MDYLTSEIWFYSISTFVDYLKSEVWFYSISTFVDYLKSEVWFYSISTFVDYLKSEVWFYSISTFVDYLKLDVYIFKKPSARAEYEPRSIFKCSLTVLNSEFSFSYTSCLTKAEEPSLSYYLPIAGGRIIEFMPLPRVLVLCEMQSVSSRIWTRVAVSISYDDNHYTTDV